MSPSSKSECRVLQVHGDTRRSEGGVRGRDGLVRTQASDKMCQSIRSPAVVEALDEE